MSTQIKKLASWSQGRSQQSLDYRWLVRLSVGAVVLSQGLEKILSPGLGGGGRFEQIGFPYPGALGHLVGSEQPLRGALNSVGFGTRVVALPLSFTILGAIVVTKTPILLGHGFGSFEATDPSSYGFWRTAPEMRTDRAMLLGSLYLLAVGGGRCSLDA